jgi:eukaryotic-like serine/threonine-protein kinase
MSGTGWAHVKELLYEALQLPAEARTRFLDEACSGDGALRAELASLLTAAADLHSGFLQSSPPPSGATGAPANIDTGSLAAGQLFAGRFRLISKLGEGGMGQVWLAEQTAPVRRQVALKLIKAGMYDESVVQRFIWERQSLAIMDHPAIAKVFDAGATPEGQPYLVMEYVPGLPITEYCDRHGLSVPQRLALFIQACEGVQHAHLKAVIHRDLKPANILVLEVDGKPAPRIIDFGLAKASAPLGLEQPLYTRLGLLFGTPGYISPEQVNPGTQDVDTRTDVYSLGAVLYVLLTGLQPFEEKRRHAPPLDVWLRQLREDEPPTPSAKVSADRETAEIAARERGTSPKQLAKELRGDLNCITLKALERDRDRRYNSPAELAADLQRYLNHEPVAARSPSALYRLRKYGRRHRVAVGVAAGILILLVGFSVLQAVELRRTTLERDRANRERDRATRLTDFMVGMFKVAGPREAHGNTVTAREVLDKASSDIGNGLTRDPQVQADMMFVMGRVYEDLGLYPKAESLVTQARDIRQRVLGPNNASTLDAEAKVGWEVFKERRYPDAEQLLRQSVADSRQALGPSDQTTVLAMEDLGDTLTEEHKLVEAEKLQRSVMKIQERTRGPESPETVRAMVDLASVLDKQGRHAEAEKLYRQAVQIDQRIGAPEYPETMTALNNLAGTLMSEDRAADAEKFYRQALDIARRVLGPEHPETLFSMNDLANAMSDQGHYGESEKLNQEVLAARRRVYGPDHPITASSTYNLACLAALTGKRDQALALLSDAVEHGLGPQADLDIETDSDLKSLYGDDRFKSIVADAKQRAAAAK